VVSQAVSCPTFNCTHTFQEPDVAETSAWYLAHACVEGVDEWLARASAATVSGDTMTVKDEAGATIGTLRRSHG
jgi:hypothetical protein